MLEFQRMDEKEASVIWVDKVLLTDSADVEAGTDPVAEDAVAADVVGAGAVSVETVNVGVSEVTASITVLSVSSMVECSQII